MSSKPLRCFSCHQPLIDGYPVFAPVCTHEDCDCATVLWHGGCRTEWVEQMAEALRVVEAAVEEQRHEPGTPATSRVPST